MLSILAFLIVVLMVPGYWAVGPERRASRRALRATPGQPRAPNSRRLGGGIGTAWDLDNVSAVRGEHQEVTTLVDGTTLYVAKQTPSLVRVSTNAAVDISSSQPQALGFQQLSGEAGFLPPLRMVTIGDKSSATPRSINTGEAEDALAGCSPHGGWRQNRCDARARNPPVDVESSGVEAAVNDHLAAGRHSSL